MNDVHLLTAYLLLGSLGHRELSAPFGNVVGQYGSSNLNRATCKLRLMSGHGAVFVGREKLADSTTAWDEY